MLKKIKIACLFLALLACHTKEDMARSGEGESKEQTYSPTPTFIQVDRGSRKIFDPSGQPVRLRGVQVPLGFHTTQRSALNEEVVKKISSYGFNMVRVTWGSVTDGDFNSDIAVLKKFINQAVRYQLIVMIEIHNFTGASTGLDQVVKYWTSLYRDLKPYEKFLMLNVANEWGGNDLSYETYKEEYLNAIRELRKAGYRLPIVIDAAGWGQNITYLTHQDVYKQFLDLDEEVNGSKANLIFDVHMYGRWGITQGEGGAEFGLKDQYLDFHNKAPVLIGEFGWNKSGNPDGSRFAMSEFIPFVQNHGVHINVYSWSGNNPSYRQADTGRLADYSYLDLVPSNYVYDPNGSGVVQEYQFRNAEITAFGDQLIKNGRLVFADRKANFKRFYQSKQ
jgi:mannan endo-1,4-beta-mannosidase